MPSAYAGFLAGGEEGGCGAGGNDSSIFMKIDLVFKIDLPVVHVLDFV